MSRPEPEHHAFTYGYITNITKPTPFLYSIRFVQSLVILIMFIGTSFWILIGIYVQNRDIEIIFEITIIMKMEIEPHCNSFILFMYLDLYFFLCIWTVLVPCCKEAFECAEQVPNMWQHKWRYPPRSDLSFFFFITLIRILQSQAAELHGNAIKVTNLCSLSLSAHMDSPSSARVQLVQILTWFWHSSLCFLFEVLSSCLLLWVVLGNSNVLDAAQCSVKLTNDGWINPNSCGKHGDGNQIEPSFGDEIVVSYHIDLLRSVLWSTHFSSLM